MAGDSVIFRVTNPGDTESNVAPSEKIEFNTGTVTDQNGQAQRSNWHAVRDISIHPNPNKPQSIIQDGKLGTIEVVIAGFFRNPITTVAKNKLFDWSKEDADSDDFPFGRFGLRINDLIETTMLPTIDRGYILYDVFVERPENSPDEVGFIIKLYRNGTNV